MGRGTRQRLPLVVVAFGLAMTPLVPASCIEDLRSLEWGVVEGTQVDYTRVGYSETGSIAWNFYMVVVSVPTMPDYAVEWGGLGCPPCTSIGSMALDYSLPTYTWDAHRAIRSCQSATGRSWQSSLTANSL